MCGFAAVIRLDGHDVDATVLTRMGAALRHRGPDDEGDYRHGPVGFAFRRLSILDLSPAGHQPMRSDDGRFAVVFNGEIYNYVELREELQRLGVSFRSSGDTEVLLRAYEQWGIDCVKRFNGMWAFALHDTHRRKVVLSRDRLGVKPLFMCRDGDGLLLASELKAIVAGRQGTPALNRAVAARFLVRGELDSDTQTFLQGVEHVPAGSVVEVGLDGAIKTNRFWRLGEHEAAIDDPSEQLRRTLTDAVRLRMRSDVPVGVFLSGGLDSTSIICLMAQQLAAGGDQPPTAFTYQSPDFDESRYIADTVGQTGATLQQMSVGAERLWESVERMLFFQDEPVHSPTAVVGFELMRSARAAGVTVVLNGQGADETLTGYHAYFRQYWYSLASRGKLVTAVREISEHYRRHGKRTLPLATQVLTRLLTRPLAGFDWYRSAARTRRGQRRDPWGIFPPELHDLVEQQPPPEQETFHDILRRSVEVKPLPLYLRVEDRNSMAHSVEARLPFCDYRMAELGWNLPEHWKLRGPWNKYALREAMTGVIPESVRTRVDKMGFPTSARRWVAQEWYEPIRAWLSSDAARQHGLYDSRRALALLDEHRRGEADHTNLLFRLAQFEILSANHRW